MAARRKPKAKQTRTPKPPKATTPTATAKPDPEPKAPRVAYDEDTHCTIAFEQALLGKDDRQIARALGIALRTIHLWKQAHPAFMAALTRGKDLADGSVVRSLYERATGYQQKALKFFFDKETGTVIEHEYIERYPPDTTAMIFWLKNRQRHEWRDRHELSNDPENPFVFAPEVPEAQRRGAALTSGEDA